MNTSRTRPDRMGPGQNGAVREIEVAELFGAVTDPFVQHHLDPRHTRRAWVLGEAVVVDGTRARPRDVPTGPVFTCLGPPDDLAELMGRACREPSRRRGGSASRWRRTTRCPTRGGSAATTVGTG